MTNDLTRQLASLSPRRLAVLCAALQSELDSVRQASNEPIAIVGMACRFPGGSGDPEAFWQLLHAGVDATGEVPADRWDIDAYYDPEPATPGKMYTRRGAFLDRVDWFDPAFFGISPREAVSMDPQHRLLLEVAWEALEHAGSPPERLTGSRTGVFVGIGIDDYAKRHIKAGVPERIDAYAGTGNAFCFAAGRLSYLLGLEGPSLSLDTACSTSLVTVHLACQSLRARECDLALAGGVNLILSPEPSLFLSSAKALSPDGRCKTFDAAADGYARAEGCGLVVVKRLGDAVRDNDDILALIRGSAVNHCGLGSGLTVPNVKAQTAVIRDALAVAGVEPDDLAYVEAHGTGTSLGDPIEIRALQAVMHGHRAADNPLLIGSVKTNFGHLEVAAGIASLIKVVLALQHEEIPPHLHLRQINPHISLVDVPARIPTTRTPWPRRAVARRAGVSSFGLSGTNSHVIVEEAPPPPPVTGLHEEPIVNRAALLPLSARTPEALKAVADDCRRFAEGAPATPLRDLCYSASVRRSHHDVRLAVVARSIDELRESLTAFVQDGHASRVRSGRKRRDGRPRVAFVFSGQGHQSWSMGRQLLAEEPVFRSTLERCDERFRPVAGWSLLEELTTGESDSRLYETQFAQPVLFAIQVALAALWRAWGIGPDAVVGHSMGEVAAAHVAGAVCLEDALRLIYHRGRLMEAARGWGRMAVVGLPLDAATELARPCGLSVAAINSPSSTVLAGDAATIEDLRRSLEQRDVLCRLIPGDYPFHTPRMQPMAGDFVRAVGELHPEAGAVPIFSSVTGRPLHGSSLSAAHWAENFFQPVWFAKAMTALLDAGHTFFLEIGPHPVLATAVVECLRQANKEGQVLASLRRGRDERETMLDSLAALYVAGFPVDWNALCPSGKLVRLPPYPWQRQRYWLDEGEGPGSARPRAADDEFHPLLGCRLRSPVIEDAVFQATVGTGALPFLAHHRIAGSVLLPATAYVEMALAASERLSTGLNGVRDLFIREPLAFSGEEQRTIQTVVHRENGGEATFKCFALQPDRERWTLHATGTLSTAALDEPPRASDASTLDQLRRRCGEELAATEYYEALHDRGLQFGPTFRGIRRIWRGDGEALAEIRLPDGASTPAFRVHPALLDACFHVVAAALPAGADERGHDQCYVPVSCRRFRLHRSPGSEIWCQTRVARAETSPADSVSGDLRLFDSTGALLAEIEGLLFRRTAGTREASARDEARFADWLHALQWVPKAREKSGPSSEPGRWLLFCDRGGVGDAMAARLRADGQECVIVRAGRRFDKTEPESWLVDPANPQDFHRLVQEAVLDGAFSCAGAIHLWSLDASPAGEDTGFSAEADQMLGCGSVLHLVQALAGVGWSASPRLWLVTRAAQPVGGDGARVSLGQATLWGLGRSIALEHPELACARVDLDESVDEDAVTALVDEIRSGDGEDQIAFRGGTRHVLRLIPTRSPRLQGSLPDGQSPSARRAPVRLEIPTPGTLDYLVIRDVERSAPGPGQLEIEVRASGLNFKDVLNALGMYPGPAVPLGDECAGTIVALGSGVDDLRVGDEVVAVAVGALGTFATTDARLVARKPVGLSFEQAATIPIAFLTATYALQDLANISAGERVLIHAASGGVGMAALQVARRSGAEIFATAGSPKKREFLRSLGVQHVMDSRSLDFAPEVMARTDGEGIDIVLNCLSGEATRRSVLLLRQGGRFLELGKNGILSPAQVSQLRHDIAYFVVALDRLCAEKPDEVAGLLATILSALKEGWLKALPFERFTLSDAGSAFRHMAQARHIGKVVLTHGEPAAVGSSTFARPLRDDATYLITGGLGGIGLHVAQWMVKEGARHLVLLGRRGPSEAARKTIAHLQAAGAQVQVVGADVCRANDLGAALEDVRQSMPALRGVLHAASNLDDGVLMQQSWERFSRVMAPAVAGAWNLHILTRNSPLDFFVLFSSAASILGSPGQGNYAAGGAFLDALAYHRRALGLPATTINWGPWSGVGMAASLGPRGHERWATFGMERMTATQALRVLAHVLSQTAIQTAVLPMTWSRLGQQFSDGTVPPLLSLVLGDARSGQRAGALPARPESPLLQWRDVSAGDRRDMLMSHLAGEAIRILGLPRSHYVDPQESLLEMGMDSLMAVEFRNRLHASLGRALPSTLVFDYPTIESMAGYLLRVAAHAAGGDLGPAAAAEDGESADLDALLTRLEQVSEEEAQAILSQRMPKGH